MALPSTGSINMNQVNVELKKSGTATIALNDTDVRKLAGKTSGTIGMSDLRGKSNTEHVSGYTLYNARLSGAKKKHFYVTIPRNIISGTISFYSKCTYRSRCTFYGIEGRGEINAAGFSKGLSMPGTAYLVTEGSGSDSTHGKADISITFTGEWEV